MDIATTVKSSFCDSSIIIQDNGIVTLRLDGGEFDLTTKHSNYQHTYLLEFSEMFKAAADSIASKELAA
jgi:tRNA(His) 5'-end guanylyltransferase